MEMPKKYDETVGITGEYESLEPGGYICRIKNVKEEESKNKNRMLVVAFDIEEGEHKGFYQRRYNDLVQQNNDPNNVIKWPNNGIHRIMIEDNNGDCNKFFKGFITSVENSNEGYNFKENKFDEKTLKDKLFGGIFGEEEYEKMDGSIGTSTKLKYVRTVQAIRDGKYKIPDIKKLPQKGEAFEDFLNNTNQDDDLPF